MTIIHERTSTSRAVAEIERGLGNKLRVLAQTIRRDKFFPYNLAALKEKYNNEVTITIQSAIQQAYIAAIDYVAKFDKMPSLLTQMDLNTIEQQTRVEVEAFWRTIMRDTISQQVTGIFPLVNIPAATSLLAVASTFGILSFATLLKLKQLGQDDATVTWITALDERVCPICRPLQGKTWKVGDSTLQTPIRDTHPNCRCRLLLKHGRSIFSH